MIDAYFGFKKSPFAKELRCDQMIETYDIREASSRLAYTKQHRGLLMLTGEPGSGKTTVLNCVGGVDQVHGTLRKERVSL